jgi:hypothetical protein
MFLTLVVPTGDSHLSVRPSDVPKTDKVSAQAPAAVHDLVAHKAEIRRAAETLLKFYGDEALEQAEKLEQRLQGSIFAKHVRELLER